MEGGGWFKVLWGSQAVVRSRRQRHGARVCPLTPRGAGASLLTPREEAWPYEPDFTLWLEVRVNGESALRTFFIFNLAW